MKKFLLSLFLVITGSLFAGEPDSMYYISDSDNSLYTVNRITGNVTLIGATGVSDIEAMAYVPFPDSNFLYAVNLNDFGTLDLSSGTFTSIGDIDQNGTANGAAGPVRLDDIDGMMLDGQTFILWGTHRRNGAPDLLFQINRHTGAFIPNAFGPNIDYKVMTGSGLLNDIDDLGINPVNGEMWATSNNGGVNDILVKINKFTGTFEFSVTLTEDDLEGIAFHNDGTFYGTEGDANRLGTINTSTGLVNNFHALTGGDPEALSALVADANVISGTVFEDDDLDGIKDGGETGIAGVTVYMYVDLNADGTIDPEDTRIQTTVTDANGDYIFFFASYGNLLTTTSPPTFPSDYALTTDNVETATFAPADYYEQTDTGNDFGLGTDGDCDGDGIPNFYEGGLDSDSDGILDSCDIDSDNDGILDSAEGTHDFDDDGIPNYRDRDSDDDGIPDAIEANGGIAPSGYSSTDGNISGAVGANGLIDALENNDTNTATPSTPNPDSDGDGKKDFLDLDSDNDGILDVTEVGGQDADTDQDGQVDGLVDNNGNGYADALESTPFTIFNTDSAYETAQGLTLRPDYIDLDSDNDGIDDTREGWSTADYVYPDAETDTDDDGILDFYDVSTFENPINPNDQDGDGTPDYRDTDSDNDGILDNIEGNDANNDGVADVAFTNTDANGNGLDDAFDSECGLTYEALSADFGEEVVSSGSMNTGSSDLEFTYDGSQQLVGLKFSNILMANSADVKYAYIQFEVDEVSTGTVNVTIHGENSTSPADYTTNTDDISDRSTTAQSETWSPADWNTVGEIGTAQRSVDVSDIMDEIIGLGSWASGNNMAFVFSGSGTNTRIAETDPILYYVVDASFCTSNVAHQDFDGDGEDDWRDIDDDDDQILTINEQTDADGSGTVDYLEVDAGACGVGYVSDTTQTITTSTKNAADHTHSNVSSPANAEGAADGNNARLSDNDVLTLDFQDTVDTGHNFTVTWRRRNGGGSSTESMLMEYSLNGSSFTTVTTLSTTSSTLQTTNHTAGIDFRYLRFTKNPGSREMEIDAVSAVVDDTLTEVECLIDSDNDGIGDVNDIDDDNDGVLDVNEGCAASPTYDYNATLESQNSITNNGNALGSPNDVYAVWNSDADEMVFDFGSVQPAGSEYIIYWRRVSGQSGTAMLVLGESEDNTTYNTNSLNPSTTEESQIYTVVYSENAFRYIRIRLEDAVSATDFEIDAVGLNSCDDTDGDGIPDYRDIDSDNDGIPDIIEAGGVDTNNDGRVDDDTDTDGDGYADTFDSDNGGTALADGDFDGDGFNNRIDLDSDNDGIVDIIEAGGVDTDNNGIVDGTFTDGNGNGWANTFDALNGGTALAVPNTDGTTDPDYLDLDADNDGIPDIIEAGGVDTDNDGVVDTATDTDDDGWANTFDSDNGGTALANNDQDNDGIDNRIDLDSDNDGIADVVEAGGTDANNDGIIDGYSDANGNGYSENVDGTVGAGGTALPVTNTDGSGEPDYLDIDADDDGIVDVIEAQASGSGINTPSGNDADDDGIDDNFDGSNTLSVPVDTDGDGTPDYIDTDSDGDGLSDYIEAYDTDGDNVADVTPTADTDNDGLLEGFDLVTSTVANQSSSNVNNRGQTSESFPDDDNPTTAERDWREFDDQDNDGVADRIDVDDDNDGILDVDEGFGNNNPVGDEDGDGIPNYKDVTDNGNGGDGSTTDYTDSNSDGIPDVFDTDGDGIANHLDLDADNDGIPDIIEAGGVDTDGDGVIDGAFADTDGDGLHNTYDTDNGGDNISNNDSDGDGIANNLDLDSDNDGIPDVVEVGGTDENGDGRADDFVDADEDGFNDVVDGDQDNDGTADNTANALLISGADTDADGIPNSYPNGDNDNDGVLNHLDLDADNDGITDVIEAGGTDVNGDGRADDFVDADSDGFNDAVDGDPTNALTVGSDAAGANTDDALVLTGPDSDNDGNPNTVISDDVDADGVHNFLDLDSDNDGIPDVVEAGGTDENGDGRADDYADADGDGFNDVVDGDPSNVLAVGSDASGANTADALVLTGADSDGDGAPNSVINDDNDGDGIYNFHDLDADNDGIADVVEAGGTDVNGDGRADAYADADGDGFNDVVDGDPTNVLAVGSDASGANTSDALIATGADTDGDGEPNSRPNGEFDGDNVYNFLDLDSDDDGILDNIEAGGTDANRDGQEDSFTDADGDGFNDVVDGDPDNSLAAGSDATDSNLGAVLTATGTDTDGDGAPNSFPNDDFDSDNLYNFLDIDADNDGITDNTEGQGTATYVAPDNADADGDGIDDAYDNDDANFGGASSSFVLSDIDATANPNTPDYLDLDTDDDGVLDAVEGHDTDGDGAADASSPANTGVSGGTTDADGDGLLDGYDNNTSSQDPTNTNLQGTSHPNVDNSATAERDWREIADNDQDGVANNDDVDDDNDGILDVDEGFGNNNPVGDEDNDGIPNYLDVTDDGNGGDGSITDYTDADGNGIPDVYDTDGDGVPNHLDLDADNDGIADIIEAGGVDTDGDGRIDGAFADTDGDGLHNTYDTDNGGDNISNNDTDGDGVPDNLDLDSDNDGIPDVVEVGGTDTNGDGRADNFTDSDNDGFNDDVDGDVGNDGTAENTANAQAVTGTDTDGDGIPNSYPNEDKDGDGIMNHLDLDSDNDGIADVVEAGGTDVNGDGRADAYTDADGDGFNDVVDGDPTNVLAVGSDASGANTGDALIATGTDTDGDGEPNSRPNGDFDGDNIYNFLDLDSDDDGILDNIEAGGNDSDRDGQEDAYVDVDGDGFNDVVDGDPDNSLAVGSDATDSNLGGVLTATGTDTDGDGAPNSFPNDDFDGDNLFNFLDIDADNDGITDNIEGQSTAGYVAPTNVDNDGDGIDNAYDNDDFNFGGSGSSFVLSDVDSGADPNSPDYLDLDSDNDGLTDAIEGHDATANGGADAGSPANTGVSGGSTDADEDGLLDGYDNATAVRDPTNGSLTPASHAGVSNPGTAERDWREIADKDNDGVADVDDIDDDNDGIPDANEGRGGTNPIGDEDGDGIPNYRDVVDDGNGGDGSSTNYTDADGNGFPDVFDADGDSIPNHLDLDADNDGIPDLVEAGGEDVDNNGIVDGGFVDTDGDGLIDDADDNNGGTALADEDKDLDGLKNRLDLDADNDGIADIIEAGGVDADNDGRADATTDTDADGWKNTYDADNGGSVLPVLDSDGDGNENYLDLDSDQDGITDNVEGQTTAAFLAPLNTDTDDDGWDDRYDSDNGGTAITLSDKDLVGLPDYLDDDSDGDGFEDWKEGFDDNGNGDALDDMKTRATNFENNNGNPGVYLNNIDSDGDLIPDWLEDADGDGYANFLDPDNVTYYRDNDDDGIVDLYDRDDGGVPSTTPDENGDGEFDFRDSFSNAALPIELVSFEAVKFGDQVKLTWVTSAEIENDYFTIERSFDGINFEPILTHPGAGNSARIIEYTMYDENPKMGINYYRLTQTDFNGQSETFEVRVVEFEGENEGILVYPNPASTELFVRLTNLKKGKYTIALITQDGKLINEQQIQLEYDNSTYEIEVLEGQVLARSNYMVRIISKHETKTIPVVIQPR